MPEETWSIRRAFEWTRGYLDSKGDEQARLSTEWLLGGACELSRIEVYTQFDRPLSIEERDTLREMVRRRAGGEPLQYITGETAFRHLRLKVRPGVLIPRPETEVLVDLALEVLRVGQGDGSGVPVLDLCTGTGCVGLALAHEYPTAQVTATDISPEAVTLANENAHELKLTDRFIAHVADLFDVSIDEQSGGSSDHSAGAKMLCGGNQTNRGREEYFHSAQLIVANPPYIPTAALDALPREVAAFEPRLALDGGSDGLDLARRILRQAPDHLSPTGALIIELDERNTTQAAELAVQLERYKRVDVRRDLAGRARFLVAAKE